MKRAEIEQLLPAVFQRAARPGRPLTALLDVMEALHRPAEAALEQIDAALDPRRTAASFAPYLAQWVDLAHILPVTTGLECVRQLTGSAAELAWTRGTARGLILFLETATGLRGFTIDEKVIGPDGEPLPFHVRIIAPAAAEKHRPMLVRIVEAEKPAYVTYELVFEDEAAPQ